MEAPAGRGKSQFCEDCTGLRVGGDREHLSVTISHQIAGIIATNTTIRRDGLKTQVAPTGVARGVPTARRSQSRWH